MKSVQKATVGITLTSITLIFSIFGFLITGGTLARFGGNRNVHADGCALRVFYYVPDSSKIVDITVDEQSQK